MYSKILGIFLTYAVLLPTMAFAQAPAAAKVYTAPKETIDKIRDEGLNRSQVMQTLSYLTDVIGPRLTNSPNMKRANEWTRDTMAKWGMNAKLVSFGPFGRGWSLKSFSAQVVDPYTAPVIAYPLAWSPSTNGTVTSEVVYLDIKTDEDFEKYKGQLKGKIVFISPPRELKAEFDPLASRYTEEALAKLAADIASGRPGNFGPPPPPSNAPPTPEQVERQRQSNITLKKPVFVFDEGAAVVVENSFKGSGGSIVVHAANGIKSATAPESETSGRLGRLVSNVWSKEGETRSVPQITMATEDYNRIIRMIQNGVKPKMTIDIQAQYYDEDLMGYNTIAEIPGTDPTLKDEVVMLGGHLDSWHASTGATDNAAGCAVAMEAARILLASGLKPRRTIRVALWSGEEQGLHGSREYVKQQFGEMKPAGQGQPREVIKAMNYDKLSVYYNLDNGTGRIRGIYTQGNAAVRPYFEAWLAPFHDLGAKTLTNLGTGGTDHIAFDVIGLPGFQFIQDTIEYDTRTHHTNQDNYDRIQADDMKQAATIMAAFIYQSAMMDEKLPRKAIK